MPYRYLLFDILNIAIILFAIIAPARFYQASRFPADRAARWGPRVRLCGIAALILFIVSRFLMMKFIWPRFEHLDHL